MIRTAASRILSSATFGRRQLSTKGFQNWLLTSSSEDQKSEEIEFPQTGLSKPSERASSSFKSESSGGSVQRSASTSSTSQLVKVDAFKSDSLDYPYSKSIKTDKKKDEKPQNEFKSSSLPSAIYVKPKANDLTQQSQNQSKDHRKKSKGQKPCSEDQKKSKGQKPCSDDQIKSKGQKPCSDDKKESNEQMCSSHSNMVPPSDILEQLKTFELESKCTAFHLKSSGHDR
jgi:hypothetical protein